MAFDKTLPNNQTKIRNYPTVLTDNFAGIQEGDESFQPWQLNMIDRDSVAGAPPPASDPTRIDDTMIIFSKEDGAANTELFVMDDNNTANIIQFTENGYLGSQYTNVGMDSFSFDGGTTTYNENNIVSAYGLVASNGTAYAISGATSSRASTGVYSITFSTARSNANYCPVITTADAGSSIRCAKITGLTTSGFSLDIRNGSNSLRDCDFSFHVVGGI